MPGVTSQSVPLVSITEPSPVSAAAISSVSRDLSARRTAPDPSARAARTSSRLVSDLEPGSSVRSATGVRARGAAQRSVGAAAVT
jgi:hypothetical protein